MMEQASTAGPDVGSTDYYRQFAEFTVDMYKVMQGLRTKVSAPDFTSDVVMKIDPNPVAEPVEDIF